MNWTAYDSDSGGASLCRRCLHQATFSTQDPIRDANDDVRGFGGSEYSDFCVVDVDDVSLRVPSEVSIQMS
jgi:hypothetical protein